MKDRVAWLVTVPVSDINFRDALKRANAEEVQEAIRAIQDPSGKVKEGRWGKYRVLNARLLSLRKRDLEEKSEYARQVEKKYGKLDPQQRREIAMAALQEAKARLQEAQAGGQPTEDLEYEVRVWTQAVNTWDQEMKKAKPKMAKARPKMAKARPKVVKARKVAAPAKRRASAPRAGVFRSPLPPKPSKFDLAEPYPYVYSQWGKKKTETTFQPVLDMPGGFAGVMEAVRIPKFRLAISSWLKFEPVDIYPSNGFLVFTAVPATELQWGSIRRRYHPGEHEPKSCAVIVSYGCPVGKWAPELTYKPPGGKKTKGVCAVPAVIHQVLVPWAKVVSGLSSVGKKPPLTETQAARREAARRGGGVPFPSGYRKSRKTSAVQAAKSVANRRPARRIVRKARGMRRNPLLLTVLDNPRPCLAGRRSPVGNAIGSIRYPGRSVTTLSYSELVEEKRLIQELINKQPDSKGVLMDRLRIVQEQIAERMKTRTPEMSLENPVPAFAQPYSTAGLAPLVRSNRATARKKFKVGQRIPRKSFEAWLATTGDHDLQRKYRDALEAYKQFHQGALPQKVSFDLLDIGGSMELPPEVLYSAGVSPVETYTPAPYSGKAPHSYYHEYEDQPEVLIHPKGKLVLKPLHGRAHVSDWFYH